MFCVDRDRGSYLTDQGAAALCIGHLRDYHRPIARHFPTEINLNMVGPVGLRCHVSSIGKVVLALTIAVLFAPAAFTQTKPERQSKAAKPAQASQTAPAPEKEKNAEDAESSKPEEKAFKGMKYRLIGPFRGGRSLTAAGIPGDSYDLLFRRYWRRSLEIHRWRHDLVVGF